MRISPIRGSVLPLVLFCLVLPRGAAAQQRCEHEAQRSVSAALGDVERVHIIAGSGSLEVSGRAGATGAAARGRACASSADDLEDLRIETRRDGRTLVIEAHYPDHRVSVGNRYASIDLVVDVPEGTPVRVEDGSGDARVSGTGDTYVDDGSGNLVLADIRGDLRVVDGSGNLEIRRVGGDVDVEDGSGNLDIEEVLGSVDVDDGSGNIGIRRVGGSVVIDDGSGDVRIETVTRDVRVDDGSGSIHVDGVGGDFIVEDDGSGSVSHTEVRGRTSVPRDR